MTEITNQLMFNVLKEIQATLAEIKSTQSEHSRLLIRVREDINTLRSDDLRLESMQAQMDVRLERIERRLNLQDA